MKYEVVKINNHKYFFNPKNKRRCFSEEPFGFSLYANAQTCKGVKSSTFIHYGIVGTIEDANKWIKGKIPHKLITIY